MTFSKSILKKISTSDVQKPDSPQIIISNPLDADTFVNGIELILSAEFSKKGKLIIEINDVVEFHADDSDQFDGYSKYPIQLGKEFQRGEDIKVYAWNGTDSNEIKMSLNTSISENLEPFNSQAVPLGKDVFNTVVSQSQTVFATENRSDSDEQELIDLDGYKKMVLILASDLDSLPAVDTVVGAYTDTGNVVDGDLDTLSGSVTPAIGDYTANNITVDFGSIASRGISAKVQDSHGGSSISSISHKLEISDDKISWTLVDEQTNACSGCGSIDQLLSGGVNTFRYARVSQRNNLGFLGNARIYEIYDSEILGGSASVSFEVLDENSNQWITLISASDIGAFGFGTPVIKTIGDVINDLANDKFNYALPSSQTNFRARLIVTGNLNVGVSIIKVA